MKFLTFLTVIRNLHPHMRSISAIGIGGLVALLMPPPVDWEIRLLGGWDAGIVSLLSYLSSFIA